MQTPAFKWSRASRRSWPFHLPPGKLTKILSWLTLTTAFKNDQKFHIAHRPLSPSVATKILVVLERRLGASLQTLEVGSIFRKYNIDLATEKVDFATGTSDTLTQTWTSHTERAILSILGVASMSATSVFIGRIKDSGKIHGTTWSAARIRIDVAIKSALGYLVCKYHMNLT
jgi:hypothetical protein